VIYAPGVSGAQGDGGGGPPKLDRVVPSVPGASRGLAAPEVTAAAAIAAGLPYQGTLAKDGPLRLCYLAAAAQASGRLDLETERSRFALHFRRGSVEHAASDAAEGDLGRFLVSRGTVSQEAVADAERVRGDLGGDLVAALSSLGLLNPAESFRVLQEHGIAVLARALGAEKGNCRWTPGGPLPPSSFPLGSRWGVLCGAARGLDGLAVRKLLGDRIQRVASRTGGRVQLPELKLTAHEARAAALFDGMSSPAQLAAARPLDAETLLRMALFLGELELLAFGNLSAAAPAPTPTPSAAPAQQPAQPRGPSATPAEPSQLRAPANAPTPRTIPASVRAASGPPTASPRPGSSATAPPAGPPGPKPRAEQEPRRPAVPDAASLKDFYEKVRASDHFTTLGVKREATTQQIKAAYFQLAKSYHPDAGLPGEPDEVKKLRVDVFARLGAAWGVLGEEAKRAEYLRELESGGGAELDVSAIFKAEELFQKATVLVRTRQYDKALETLTEASKLNAEEPEFDVWRAWVDFLVAQDRKRQHQKSAAVIEAALKKVPRCLPGYLFLGQMAKISGDIALAERHFKRGLALDPEHAELAREMKYLKK
jgi:tetratricopeptide (TPR) repeat protein